MQREERSCWFFGACLTAYFLQAPSSVQFSRSDGEREKCKLSRAEIELLLVLMSSAVIFFS